MRKRMQRKEARIEKIAEKHKNRYPSRAIATILWILVGIGCVLVFTLPLVPIDYFLAPLVRQKIYLTGMVIANIAFAPFWIGSILYSVHLGRNGIHICPNCGKRAFRGRKYCINCGARLFWFCPKCGERTSKKREFCDNCGQSIKIVTFARQIDIEGAHQPTEVKSRLENVNPEIIVTGSIIQFCPACGAEISEDLTHCQICGSQLGPQ
jgi:hypothetical protein